MKIGLLVLFANADFFDSIFCDNRWGQLESGIDGGGLFKEFLTELAKEVFDPARGLWLSTSQNELWPNPHSYAKEREYLTCVFPLGTPMTG